MEYKLRLYGWLAGSGGSWGFDIDHTPLKFKLLDSKSAKFWIPGRENDAWIIVRDLAPTKITKTVFHDPITLNKELTDAYSSVASNNSDTVEMTRSYEIAESTEVSTSVDVGASVTLGISQSIAAGGDLYGFTSTTEINASITASFNYNAGSSEGTERTVSTEITVPPKTRTTLTATKSKSKLKQTVDYWCGLEFSMEIMNRGSYHSFVDSQADLKKLLDGNSYPGMIRGEGPAGENSVYKALEGAGKNEGYYKTLTEATNTQFSHEIEFDRATTGDVILTSEKI